MQFISIFTVICLQAVFATIPSETTYPHLDFQLLLNLFTNQSSEFHLPSGAEHLLDEPLVIPETNIAQGKELSLRGSRGVELEGVVSYFAETFYSDDNCKNPTVKNFYALNTCSRNPNKPGTFMKVATEFRLRPQSRFLSTYVVEYSDSKCTKMTKSTEGLVSNFRACAQKSISTTFPLVVFPAAGDYSLISLYSDSGSCAKNKPNAAPAGSLLLAIQAPRNACLRTPQFDLKFDGCNANGVLQVSMLAIANNNRPCSGNLIQTLLVGPTCNTLSSTTVTSTRFGYAGYGTVFCNKK